MVDRNFKMMGITIDLPVIMVIFIGSVCYLSYYYSYGLNMLDEGYLVTCTMRVLEGQVPYIDFQNNYAPGRYYIFAGLVKIFGNNLLVFRGAWVVLIALGAVIVYLLLYRISGRIPAFFAAIVIPLFRCPWHKSFFVVLPFLCALCYFAYIEKRKTGTLILSGLITAFTFFVRQDVGVYSFVSLFATILVISRKEGAFKDALLPLSLFSAAFLAGMSPILLYYFHRGSFIHMLDQLLFAGARDVGASTIPFPVFGLVAAGNLLGSLKAALFYCPLIVYLAGFILAARELYYRRAEGETYKILLMSLLAGLLYVQLLNRTDLPHLWQIFPSAFVLLVIVLSMLVKTVGRQSRSLLISGGVIFVAAYGAVYFSAMNPQAPPGLFPNSDYVRLEFKRAPMMVPRSFADELYWLKNEVESSSRPGDYILAVPDIPMVYYLLDRKNPIEYDLLRPGIADDPKLQEQIVTRLKGVDIPCLVLNEKEVYDGRRERLFKNRAPIIHGYLMDTFELDKKTRMFSVWTAG